MKKAADVIESNNRKELFDLIIAARKAFDTFTLPDEEQRNLDKALEKFSVLVPYDEDTETGMTNQESATEKPVCPICKGFSAFDQCSCHYQ